MPVHRFGPQSTVGQKIIVANEIGFAAAAGQVTGLAPVYVSAYNLSAGTSEEDVWFNGGTITWLTAAVQMDVVSSDVNDDGNPTTNTGAQTIRIEYLDSNFDEQTEDVTLNGTGTVTTTASMLRINRAYVLTAGTYHGTNVGNITIRVTGGGALQANIEAGAGTTQKSHYTVPNGKAAYLIRFDLNVDSTKTTNFRMWALENADDITQPYTGAKQLIHRVTGISGTHSETLRSFPRFPAKTDIWWTSEAGAASTDLEVDYDLALEG